MPTSEPGAVFVFERRSTYTALTFFDLDRTIIALWSAAAVGKASAGAVPRRFVSTSNRSG